MILQIVWRTHTAHNAVTRAHFWGDIVAAMRMSRTFGIAKAVVGIE